MRTISESDRIHSSGESSSSQSDTIPIVNSASSIDGKFAGVSDSRKRCTIVLTDFGNIDLVYA